MGPLATTELGTDSWMPDLLQGVGLSATAAGWVFIYVSTLMTILRFYAGPIVHRFSPIGLLVISAIVAIVGLLFLSKATVGMIVVAATVSGPRGRGEYQQACSRYVSEYFENLHV